MDFVNIDNPAPRGSIFDTHAHYDDERFDGIRDDIFDFMQSNGVFKIINCAIDTESAQRVTALSKKHKFCFSAVGFHPENLPGGEPQEHLSKLLKFIDDPKTVAIGEIGLDYHYRQDNSERQKKWFAAQADFAKQNGLPVIVHDREAHADTLEILKSIKPRGVLHCFSGSCETASELIKMGMYIGVGGVSTFKNAKKCTEVIKTLPIERILLETDAPYLAPEPYRGKICNSAMIIRVAEKISDVKEIPLRDVLEITKANAETLFKTV